MEGSNSDYSSSDVEFNSPSPLKETGAKKRKTPPKKIEDKKRRMVISDDEDDLPKMPNLDKAYTQPWSLKGGFKQISEAEDEDEDEEPKIIKILHTNPPTKVWINKKGKEVKKRLTEDEINQLKAQKIEDPQSKKLLPFKDIKLQLDPNEQNWQKAMDLAVTMMVPCKVDIKDLTLIPDSGTLECFKKLAQQWLTDNKKHVNLTFSTQKSMYTMIGRFLLDFVIKAANLSTQGWVASGCAIWRHGWNDNDGIKCYHGNTMLNKEQIIEMDVNSENGQRALKEQPQKTKITTNRWGRNIVQLKNEDAVCCFMDINTSPGVFSNKSCALFFTEGQKAMDAMKQWMEYMIACYPKMPESDKRLLIPVVCDCNWGNQSLPILGRQICKMTPFAISGGLNVDINLIEDKKMRASVAHPNIMVFQCCNPVFGRAKANSQRNCDFKISAPDLVSSLQLAKQIWMAFHHKPAPITIPEFAWSPRLQYHNVILPTDQEDADDCLF
ncbi:DBP [California sea lion adenovirus 1]|uniref:DNA-binding protein n=1 Tax=California sea lion adenovirus 1 TaxID=943083 RepID=A0A059XJ46_9ADEN|nr:DBP [California sea lion adenovirus 1]AIA22359.1 DBP [California sea lion adenovirus 1]